MYPYFLFAAIHHLNRPRLSLSDLVAQSRRSNPEVVGSIPTEVKRIFSMPRVVPWFPIVGASNIMPAYNGHFFSREKKNHFITVKFSLSSSFSKDLVFSEAWLIFSRHWTDQSILIDGEWLWSRAFEHYLRKNLLITFPITFLPDADFGPRKVQRVLSTIM